ncbi:hypothetical protein PHLGIDRAFT_112417 [Phlebiopsis gigantea 11061_1 CR5-6]|uniref:MutL C-terminal dimerisation domain-containing protein n=1 Tax=Phlebiopsis gigantea (strain 11061_1 CR5-6) TaxID=745531 RepID=A0A0C3PB21_PHLG1|nr:hypothetical protein PHLGIDRAFT_112417 [Phlebiopsis gigantea 11061_1 CR5-6]
MAAPARNHELSLLPKATQSRLRSTQIIVSLPQLVSELVQNALDADAGQVEVGVDCEDWSCWVRDDGKGLSKQDLTALESVGRYGTSKAYNCESLGEVSTFGFRGEALVSIADLSCLEISSRTARSRESWSIILKGAKSLYNGPAVRWRREHQGTTVCVRDAFYSLPIRRSSHTAPARTLELIRKELETLSLVFPYVSFSLEDSHKKTSSHPDTGKITKLPKTVSTLHAFRNIFGRALVECVEEIDISQNDLRISGFISLNATTSKSHQYLYINRHILNTCDLHRTIDSIFGLSSFGRDALHQDNQSSRPLSAIRRSPRNSEKRPIYVINITIPPRHVDNCVQPSKTAVQLQNNAMVVSFLSTVVDSFLTKHGFKIQLPSTSDRSSKGPRTPRKRRRTSRSPSRDARIPLSSLPMATPWIPTEAGEENQSAAYWTDPATGVTHALDPRTGNSYPTNKTRGDEPEGRRTLSRHAQKPDLDEIPDWIQQALGANQAYVLREPKIPSLDVPGPLNEQHSCQRSPFTNFSSQTQPQLAVFSKDELCDATVLAQVDRRFIACILSAESSVQLSQGSDDSRANDTTSGMLVLIDQHAADERIRVERLMRDMCRGFTSPSEGPVVRKLDPPVPIILARREASMLQESAAIGEAFSRWGVQLRISENPARETETVFASFAAKDVESLEAEYVQIEVLSVPDGVANKLLTEGRLRELVSSYLVGLSDPHFVSSVLKYDSSQSNEDDSWQRAVQWCPRSLIDLANSTACRGAIMFNDPLTLERCERLVAELSATALPFQCAHGRPSLVPLTQVQGDVFSLNHSQHMHPVDWGAFKVD